ncbi:MAG: flagellar hook-basal body complex protein FliE [Nitrospirota bacterium]|nr:flagellar hook-basal body complex protein FliE [Nitrospirota bacterium]
MVDDSRIEVGVPHRLPEIGDPSKKNQPSGSSSGEESFVNVLKDSIAKVNSLQNEADKTIQDFSTGQNGVTLHQTMIEMAQADVSFHLMMQVRDRIVKAYQEMNNMPL